MDEEGPIERMEGFSVSFVEDSSSDFTLPPGTYTTKIVEDLNTHWRIEVVKGEHKGKRVVVPKMTLPHLRNHKGIPQSHFGEGNLH